MDNLFKNQYRIASNRLKNWDYSYPSWYFITICTYKHQNTLGSIKNDSVELNIYGKIVYDEWIKTGIIRKEIELDEFIIIPNHIHGIIGIDFKNYDSSRICRDARHCGVSKYYKDLNPLGDTMPCVSTNRLPKSISTMVSGFKACVTKRINEMRNTQGEKVWQSNYYDHIIRNENSLNKIRTYIRNNPLLWEKDEYSK